MDYSELDQAEMEKRKKDQIVYRNKKKTSALFTFSTSIFEIIISLLIFFALYIIAAAICSRLPNAETVMTKVFPGVTIFVLVASIVIGFNLYKAFGRFLIKKFDLEEKMLESVVFHFKTRKEQKEY